MVAGCQDGHGEGFYRNLADVKDPKIFRIQAINTQDLKQFQTNGSQIFSAYSSTPPLKRRTKNEPRLAA